MPQRQQRPNAPPLDQQSCQNRRRRAEESDHRTLLLRRQGHLRQGTPTCRSQSRTEETGPLPRQQDRQSEGRTVHGGEEG